MNLYPLAPEHHARANTFYRAHHSSMRASAKVQVWVAEAQEIVAALCLQPVDSGLWPTSLLATPAHRHKGLASQLLSAACTTCQGEVWLFCEPHLVGFYAHQGFRQTARLPPALASRLTRYPRKKPWWPAIVRRRWRQPRFARTHNPSKALLFAFARSMAACLTTRNHTNRESLCGYRACSGACVTIFNCPSSR